MSFEFLISSDDGEIFNAIVTNSGRLVVFSGDEEELDVEAELAAMELGFGPSAGFDAINIWNSFIQYLDDVGMLESLIDDVSSSGEMKKEWVPPGYFSDEPGYYREYTSTFTVSELLEYIGPVMQKWLHDEDDLSVDMAKFLSSVRRKNGKSIRFRLSNSGEWEIETRPGTIKVWSGIDRELVADEVVLAKWTEDFEREIYDPVSLVSEVDLSMDRDQTGIAGSRELQEVIAALGLEKEEKRLDEEAAKDAPGPDAPEREDEGSYGVLYDRYELSKDPVTGQWGDVRKIDVVPYWSLKDAEWALSLSEEIVDDRGDDREGWFRMEIVRRLSALHVVRDLQEKEELTEDEADFLERQLTLFEQYEMDASPVSPFPGDIDVWTPIGEEEDDDE